MFSYYDESIKDNSISKAPSQSCCLQYPCQKKFKNIKKRRKVHSYHFLSYGESSHKLFSITKDSGNAQMIYSSTDPILIPPPKSIPDSILIPSQNSNADAIMEVPPDLNTDSIQVNLPQTNLDSKIISSAVFISNSMIISAESPNSVSNAFQNQNLNN